MHRVNAGYTLLARLKRSSVEAAATLLAELDAHPDRLPFARSATTHFATLAIIPRQQYRDEELPATLLLGTSFAGPAQVHVRELVRVLGKPLRELFAHCEGFEPGCDDDALEEFIAAHRHGDTFYSGMQNLAPEDVQRHRELRDAIETFLDEQQARGALPDEPAAARRAIQAHVRSRPELAWAQQPFAPTFRAWLVLHWRTLIVQGILAVLVLATLARIFFVHDAVVDAGVRYGWLAVGVAALGIVGLVLAVREAEAEQTYVSGRQPDAVVRALAATQNRPVINEFVIAGPIKEEGALRPLFLRIALWIVARLAEGIPGLRAGIVIPTVATARWIAADRGRRLIFISNYTNNAEGYVRDFIDTEAGAKNINLSFGFGRGYPKTEWIVRDGAVTDPNAFIYVVTENERHTGFWYGPYRDMTIDNIEINRQIREGLFADLDEDQTRTWLQLL